jgi:hypothetical protein
MELFFICLFYLLNYIEKNDFVVQLFFIKTIFVKMELEKVF